MPDPVSHKRKDPKRLYRLSKSPVFGRLAVVNHFKSAVSKVDPRGEYPKLSLFLSRRLWTWIWQYIKNLGPRTKFRTYENAPHNGVYQLKPAPGASRIQIALAGDWGTGTDEAAKIATLMSATNPDLTLHLGDVYYVGNKSEIEENFLGRKNPDFLPVKWSHGAQGSFSLIGNHELYAGGGPYYTVLLPTLGMNGQKQLASFFCLELDHWRILALDTGYNSSGWPILSQIPGIKNIPIVGGDCHLEKPVLDWLRTQVAPDKNKKATLILSHHQYLTAFPGEQEYPRAAQQIAEFFKDQEVLWIWGHEHRLAFYNRVTTPEWLTFYGRCVGHSGMPVEPATPDLSKGTLLCYDGDPNRTHKLDDGTVVGQNGFVNLTFEGTDLTLDYRDIDNIQLLVERFTPNADGTLQRTVVTDPAVLWSPH
ncbi:MAG TPA: metallophosphoesterase [Verrucomicrobiae bacterium]|jgi:hypothetical protein|nr:metallophosphoesterase [Verrucomicrobiae bacterium]